MLPLTSAWYTSSLVRVRTGQMSAIWHRMGITEQLHRGNHTLWILSMDPTGPSLNFNIYLDKSCWLENKQLGANAQNWSCRTLKVKVPQDFSKNGDLALVQNLKVQQYNCLELTCFRMHLHCFKAIFKINVIRGKSQTTTFLWVLLEENNLSVTFVKWMYCWTIKSKLKSIYLGGIFRLCP